MNSSTRIMELMDTDFVCPVVSPEHSINQAWQVLGACCHNSDSLVLVTNKDKQLEGVINPESIFKSIEPGILNVAARMPGGGVFNEGNHLIACLLPNRSIKEIMLPVDKIALNSTDTVTKAFFLLLNNDVGALPVLNVYKHVIGIVNAADVFHALGLSSSYCKLAFPGYDYSRHGVFNTSHVNSSNDLNNESSEQKQKHRVYSLQTFNPKIAIIAVLVGLMLSILTPEIIQTTGVLYGKGKIVAQVRLHQIYKGSDTDEAGTMVIAFNNMVTKLQSKTVKLPESYGKEIWVLNSGG